MNLNTWYYSQNAIGGSGNSWPKRITIGAISIVNETSGYIKIPTSFYPRCLFNVYSSEELVSSYTLTSDVLINSRVIPPGGSYQIAQNLTTENQKNISSPIDMIDLTIGPSVGSFDWRYSSSVQGTGVAISQFVSYLTYEYEDGSVSAADYYRSYYNNINIQTDANLPYYISKYDKTNETLVFFEPTPLLIHIESCMI